MNRLFLSFTLFFSVVFIQVKGQNADAPLEFDLTNPGLFAGTDFGNYFQRLYLNQDYTLMLKFTSKKSRKKFSDEQLLSYYRKMEFAYHPLKLKSKSIEGGDTIWLNYITNIQATQRMVRMPVVVERDTVRMLILEINRRSFLID